MQQVSYEGEITPNEINNYKGTCDMKPLMHSFHCADFAKTDSVEANKYPQKTNQRQMQSRVNTNTYRKRQKKI